MRLFPRLLGALLLLASVSSAQTGGDRSTVATYSIVARDPSTGDLGIAVQSKFLGVGAVVPWAQAGTGAVATQASANTIFGPEGLRMLGYGWSARQVIDSLLAMDPDREIRQVGIVDSRGTAAAFTGSKCRNFAGHRVGNGYAVQGNILAGENVIVEMALAFERTEGDLAKRLLAAMDAGEKAGGDSRGRQSAALLVVREEGGYGGFNDRFIDIRVDDNPDPLTELRRIYDLWDNSFVLESRMAAVDRFNRNKQYEAAQRETQRIVDKLNRALRDSPDDADVLNRVAWILATYELAKERALELAKRAATLAPGRSEILNTLAECHFRLGHTDEAIAIESELVAKEPGNDYYWKQLQKFKAAKGN